MTKIQFHALDLESNSDLRIYGKTEKGQRICAIDTSYQPYFWVTDTYGSYSGNWSEKSNPTIFSVIPELTLIYGVNDWIEIQTYTGGIYDRQSGKDAFVYLDTEVDIGFYLCHSGEYMPDLKFAIYEVFPTGRYKNLNEDIKVDGFRKNMVPENVLAAKVGEFVIDQETAELALSRAYMNILIDRKIDAIGRPQVTITKLARGNPLEFKIITAVVPEVKLPDYKKIAQVEVSDLVFLGWSLIAAKYSIFGDVV